MTTMGHDETRRQPIFRNATVPSALNQHPCSSRSFIVSLLFSIFFITYTEGATSSTKLLNYTFALVPKSINDPVFIQAKNGCEARSQDFMLKGIANVTCLFVGPPSVDALEQASLVEELIWKRKVDGISVSVTDAGIANSFIKEANLAGIPVVTFDSDASNSGRVAYIGTDNFAFGKELGKMLDQVAPEGGSYGIVTSAAPNVRERVRGIRDRLKDTNWVEVPDSPMDCKENEDVALQQMWHFTSQSHLKGILSVGAWPARDPNTTRWKRFVDANKDLKVVMADTLPVQLELINQGYITGLVGQLFYNMGELSMETLLTISQGGVVRETNFITAMLEVLRFPVALPGFAENKNYIGSLALVGYISFGIVTLLSLGFSTWTFLLRKNPVVRASQPFFLIMISTGVLVMGSAILPLTIDDQHYSERGTNIACMSIPWLVSIGFTTTFSALFSKTWRINKIFRNSRKFRRMRVSEKDVLVPFMMLLTANIAVLATWTALEPLKFIRRAHEGTDEWNRVISTYGSCASEGNTKFGATPFLFGVGMINVGALLIANVQVYQARMAQTQYSEGRAIAIVMASMLQAAAIGGPVFFLVYDIPRAFYMISTVFLFVVCVVILMLMFGPKMYYVRQWSIRKKRKLAEIGLRESMAAAGVDDGNKGIWVSRRTNVVSGTINTDSAETKDGSQQERTRPLQDKSSVDSGSRASTPQDFQDQIQPVPNVHYPDRRSRGLQSLASERTRRIPRLRRRLSDMSDDGRRGIWVSRRSFAADDESVQTRDSLVRVRDSQLAPLRLKRGSTCPETSTPWRVRRRLSDMSDDGRVGLWVSRRSLGGESVETCEPTPHRPKHSFGRRVWKRRLSNSNDHGATWKVPFPGRRAGLAPGVRSAPASRRNLASGFVGREAGEGQLDQGYRGENSCVGRGQTSSPVPISPRRILRGTGENGSRSAPSSRRNISFEDEVSPRDRNDVYHHGLEKKGVFSRSLRGILKGVGFDGGRSTPVHQNSPQVEGNVCANVVSLSNSQDSQEAGFRRIMEEDVLDTEHSERTVSNPQGESMISLTAAGARSAPASRRNMADDIEQPTPANECYSSVSPHITESLQGENSDDTIPFAPKGLLSSTCVGGVRSAPGSKRNVAVEGSKPSGETVQNDGEYGDCEYGVHMDNTVVFASNAVNSGSLVSVKLKQSKGENLAIHEGVVASNTSAFEKQYVQQDMGIVEEEVPPLRSVEQGLAEDGQCDDLASV